MQLFWKDNILIINKIQYQFISNIKKVHLFNNEIVVLTHTLIFIDIFPYSPFDKLIPFNTKINIFKNDFYLCNALHLEEQVRAFALEGKLFYQQKDMIYSIEHKYSEPEFILQCKYEMLDVSELYFIFKIGPNVLLRQRNEEKYFICSFNFTKGLDIIPIDNLIDQSEYIDSLNNSKIKNNLINMPIDQSEFTNTLNQLEIINTFNCFERKNDYVTNSILQVDFNNINEDINLLNYFRIKNIILFYFKKKIIFFNLFNFQVEIKNLCIDKINLCKHENKIFFLINNEIFDENLIGKRIKTDDHLLLNNGFSTNFLNIKVSSTKNFELKLVQTHNPLSYIKRNIYKLEDINYINLIKENYLNKEIIKEKKIEIKPINKPNNFQEYLNLFDQKKEKQIFYLPENDFLNKKIRIKKELKIRKKVFTEFPNLIKFKKISSLNFNNLSKIHREAILLCFEEMQNYMPNENDLENKKGKIYKLRRSVQSSFILHGCLKPSFSGNGFNNCLVRILVTDLENKIYTVGNKIDLESSIFTGISNTIDSSTTYNNIYNNICINTNNINNDNQKIRIKFTKSELAGFILGLGIRRSYLQAYLSNDTFINSISLIASSLTNEGKKDESLLSNLSSNNLVHRACALIAISYSYKCTGYLKVINLLINEANKFGSINKDWYDINYRLIAAYSIINIHKKIFTDFSDTFLKYNNYSFINLNDKLIELIVNGILFFNSNNTKIIKKLSRNNRSRLEEVFYSEIFINTISIRKIELPNLQTNYSEYEIYKIAGKYFYIAIYYLINRNDVLEITNELIKNCLFLEEIIFTNPNYKIILDTILIALSIINNGTSDFNILKLLRKSINLQGFNRNIDFVNGKYETNYFLRYGDYLKYKMCIGLLCCGLNNFQLNKDCLLELIFAFYLDWPMNEEDQRVFSFFRHNLCSKFVRKDIWKGDWKEEDKTVLFDLYSNFYEKNGVTEYSLDEFCD